MKFFGQGLICPALDTLRALSRAGRLTVAAALVVAVVLIQPMFAQPTQPIYLQYDGFVRNPDGTITVSFGYFNMNNVNVTIQPGGANSFAPGAGDRNQPVTFLKGRHRFACSMVVDKSFDGKLQWTLQHAGKTSVTTAKTLDPLYELEKRSADHATAGLDLATAPKNLCVNRAPSAHVVANPFGDVNAAITAKVDQEMPLNGQVEDDGLRRGSKVTIAWKKNSGPGDVTFSDTATGPTRVKFSAPGSYELELSATDGEKTTSTKVIVTVTPK
jgi:hypothetical protein